MSQTMVRTAEGVTGTVVEELASAKGVGVFDVAPLFESVDPDALEQLFADEAGDHLAVEFTHDGYRVRIDGGRVSVEAVADSP